MKDARDLVESTPLADILEVEQLLARYSVAMTRNDVDAVIDVFTPDGTYSAFGSAYTLEEFPALVEAAPKGLFMTGTPALDLGTGVDRNEGTGMQTLCFVDQTNHDMRIGYYTDSYQRTEKGWRLHTRSMTFLRRSGARDAGKEHDPRRPIPQSSIQSAGN
jgi:hypothetical protein